LVLQKALMGFLWFNGRLDWVGLFNHGLKPKAIDSRSSVYE
jgi:hypothetical protein